MTSLSWPSIIRVLVAGIGLYPFGATCNAQNIHEWPTPSAGEFAQPPLSSSRTWRGPLVAPFPVQCWHIEPNNQAQSVGGTEEWQKVSAFAAIDALLNGGLPDQSFQQAEPLGGAGGGASSVLNAADIPRGLFLSFKGHPIFRIAKVRYPANGPLYPFVKGPRGVLVDAEFLHGAHMGECYFYIAVWAAVPN